MFADFENMIKDKLGSLKSSSKTSSDLTRTPQKYKIKERVIQELKLLSQGSFGFIWLAEDVNTKQKFALKRIVCITKERLLLAKNQLELMTKFPKSKNLVECFGGELVTLKNGNLDTQVLIILMQYCPNGTLFDLLSSRENKGFSEKQLLQITQSILEGLKWIHNVGIYHQDVKIENVLIGEDKTYKLCDFGSCSNRFIDFRKVNKSDYAHIKEEIEAMTTPMYRPPEIVDPYLQFQVSYKVDIWMVGCVLYTLAFFTHPFVDSNAVGIAGGVYRFPKYPEETPYQVSDKVKDLIRNFLTPNPTFRTSLQEATAIVNNWYTMSQIPLNKQAFRRKQEEIVKQKQLESLHRKVVDFDGDIPMDMLMELQKKLKTKETQEEFHTKTFVSKKNTMPQPSQVTQGKALYSSNPMPNQSQPQNQHFDNFGKAQPQPQKPSGQASKQKQDTISSNSFWNSGSVPKPSVEVKKSSGGDDFANFFGANSIPQQNPNDIYDYFFSKEEPKNQAIPSNPPKKQNETNLLDL